MRPEPRPVPGLLDRLPDLESETWADPSPRNVMGLADAYRLLGRPASAIEALGPLVAEDAAAIAPRVLLAWCLAEVGRTEEAAAMLSVVQGLDPANPYARARVAPAPSAGTAPAGEAGTEAGAEAEAAPASGPEDRRAAAGTASPGEATAPTRKDDVAAEPGPAGEASASPAPPDVRTGGGEAEAEPERALTPEELARVPPSPLYSATLAEIFERQGFEEKAIQIYEQVVRAHPDRADLRERIVALRSRVKPRPS